MIRLGSSSKTRAMILENKNIDFVQIGSDFDEEQITTKDPREFVKEAVEGKFNDLFKKYGIDDYPLLVADTVVTSQNILLRKPKDRDDARKMLELQSGNSVSIITAMVYRSKDTYIEDISITTYTFLPFLKEDLDHYINSGECMGKAGAIMVEGFCKPYIKSVKGYETTAMGLCVEKLLPFL